MRRLVIGIACLALAGCSGAPERQARSCSNTSTSRRARSTSRASSVRRVARDDSEFRRRFEEDRLGYRAGGRLHAREHTRPARRAAATASTCLAPSAIGTSRSGTARPRRTPCVQGREALLDPHALISRRRRGPARAHGPGRCRRRRRSRCCRRRRSRRSARRGIGASRSARPRRARAVRVGSAVGSAVAVGVALGARPRPAVSGSDDRPTLWFDSELAAVVRPAARTRPATASTPIARVLRQPVMPHLPSLIRWGSCRRPAAA